MAYRDEHQRCPRCGTELIDAVAGLACAQCRGIWIEPSSLEEMVMQMQHPPAYVELRLDVDVRREKLPCPRCREAMQPRSLRGVEIDICEAHGLWFDIHELARVLMRSARAWQ